MPRALRLRFNPLPQMRHGHFAFLVVMLIALIAAPFAHAAETIRSFSSTVFVNLDGSVDVTETIQVRAEGEAIRRGIFRDLPLTYLNAEGREWRPDFNLLEVEKDGFAEPHHTAGIPGGIRIYIGDADVFLSPGVYTYKLRYTMSRMVRRHEDFDEIFWNATGNFWAFPIEDAVAQIYLPSGARVLDASAYTGAFGDSGQDAKITEREPQHYIFRAERGLAPFEGMSVSVSFAKGALTPISDLDAFQYWVSDHRDIVYPTLAALIVLLYYFMAWRSVGRDPARGTIIPLFYPPQGMSPALVHYVHNYGWKRSGWDAVSAALISLATKGLISIEKSDTKTVLARSKKAKQYLPPGEQIFFSYIDGRDRVSINKANGKTLGNKKTKFLAALAGENRNKYFKTNMGYTIFGGGLSILLLIGLAVVEALPVEFIFLAVFSGVGIGVLISAFSSAWLRGGLSRYFSIAIFSVIFINFASSLGQIVFDLTWEWGVIAAGSIVVINTLFGILMRAPTAVGRKVMDEIDGFKQYLEVAEKDRLKLVEEPDFTLERFEQILPYAVALGVEEKWGERLSNALAANEVSDAGSKYHPHWYSGSDFNGSKLGSSLSGISSGISTAMISSQPVSSSSSGSSGGGFSGGGGGGGGGGGW